MKKHFSEFTNQYSVSKTLRFELKPVGKTKELHETQGTSENPLQYVVAEDEERAEKYKKAKQLIDDIHRKFLDIALAEENIGKDERRHYEEIIERTYDSWKKVKDQKQKGKSKNTDSQTQQKELPKEQKKLAKELVELLKTNFLIFRKELLSKIPNEVAKKGNDISKYVVENLYKGTTSIFEIASAYYAGDPERSEIIRYFDRFHSYFSGFNENRANVYDIKGTGASYSWHFLSTSVADRLFGKNLFFHFENIEKWETIQKSIAKPENQKAWKKNGWDWKKELKEVEKNLGFSAKDFLNQNYFWKYFSQAGIDRYNEMIGGRPAKEGVEKIKGLNELFNLAFQKSESNKKRGQSFPSLNVFYKQILSDRQKNFIDAYTSDQELVSELVSFLKIEAKIHTALQQEESGQFAKPADLFEESYSQDEKAHIFLSKTHINSISKELTSEWNAIHLWYMNTLPDDKSKQKASKRKVFTIGELEAAFREKIDKKDFYETYEINEKKIQKDNIFLSYFSYMFTKLMKESKESRGKKGISESSLLDGNQKLVGDSLSDEKSTNTVKEGNSTEGDAKAKIKNYLEQANDAFRFFRNFRIHEKDLLNSGNQDENWKTQINSWLHLYENEELHISRLYNKARNYLTKKPYSLEKYKINFANSTLASGWDKNKEAENRCVIFKRDENYYLGILDKKHNHLFQDENINPKTIQDETLPLKEKKLREVKEKFAQKKEGSKIYDNMKRKISELEKEVTGIQKNLTLLQNTKSTYQKMVYKFLSSVSLNIPKCTVSRKGVQEHFRSGETSDYVINGGKGEVFMEDFAISREIFDLYNDDNDSGVKKFQKKYKEVTNDKLGYETALKKWMNFCHHFLKTYKSTAMYDYGDIFDQEYESIDLFYKKIDLCTYKISFQAIASNFIDQCVEEGKLHLFQIYNKDFSPHAKGRENLHTMYWKLLFAPPPENLKNIVFRLNGEAELFYRKRSIPKPYKHEIGSILKHKRYAEIWEETLESPISGKNNKIMIDDFKKRYLKKYEKLRLGGERQNKIFYENEEIGRVLQSHDKEIIKDRRFTSDKFFFYCPITLNNRAIGLINLNQNVRDSLLKRHPDTNIIGIDRGEKHLLYYSIINSQGEILKDGNGQYLQGSLNTIVSSYEKDGKMTEKNIDYHKMLDEKEGERGQAREKWETIENIKELKAGYLSQVIHKLCNLIIEHNAIVMLEDLNFGFKRGRFKIEKQVYQKFEKALIDKLNFLAFKGKKPEEMGHPLQAYQLTNPFESFQKLGKQSGILFYVTASYTSKVDPITGYIQKLYPDQKDLEKIKDFFQKFDSIRYDQKEKYFTFTYDLEKFQGQTGSHREENLPEQTKWTICSCVTRSEGVSDTTNKNIPASQKAVGKKYRKREIFDLNEKLKKVFGTAEIDYEGCANLMNEICSSEDQRFLKKFTYYFKMMLNLRVVDDFKDKGTSENDFIHSPVFPFYDSRCVKENAPLPMNGDANGAYNIARKGIIVLEKMAKDPKGTASVPKKDWENFSQKKEIVQKQKKIYEKAKKNKG